LTTKQKRVQWYNDLTLEAFYDSVANHKARVKLPHHDVVYVRAALRKRTGETFSYEQVHNALKAEGWSKD
jgi:hypothetical protein|tara:strand:+ start:1058 stop:1267 length:210 start_codon:yes stop_codon:yes gene_type:complete